MDDRKIKTKRFIQTENEVKKAITGFLTAHGYKVYRINNGGVYRGKTNAGKPRFSFAGDKGVADLYAIKDHHPPIWIETKRTNATPTDEQLHFGANVNKTGNSLWCYTDSLDMFISFFKNLS